LIDTTFEENDVAELSVFSNLANGHAFIHEQTNFKKNFARLGPVFVDNTSFLQLSRDNFGTANAGGQCAGIFLEDDLSLCFDREAACTGQCCAFGDESCDLYIEEDEDETQVADTEPVEDSKPAPRPAPVPSPPVNKPTPTTTSSASSINNESNDKKCGGFCKGFIFFAVISGVAIVIVFAVLVRKRRLRKATITGPSAAAMEAPELDKTIT